MNSNCRNTLLVLLMVGTTSILSCKRNRTKKPIPPQSEIIYFQHCHYPKNSTIIIGSSLNDVYKKCDFQSVAIFNQEILILTPEAVSKINNYIELNYSPFSKTDSLINWYPEFDYTFSIYKMGVIQKKRFGYSNKTNHKPFDEMFKVLYNDSLKVDGLRLAQCLYNNQFIE